MLPSRPTDRLFADKEHLETARDYAAQLAEEPPASGVGNRDGGSPTPPATGPSEPTNPSDPANRANAANGADATDPARTDGQRHDSPAWHDSSARHEDADEADIDAAFASIVAGFHTVDNLVIPSWPAAEDTSSDDSPPRRRRTDRPRDEPTPRADEPGPSLLDGLDLFGTALPDEEERFTPPPPPPLPRISKAATVALIGIAVGLLLFFKPELLPIAANVTLLLGFSAVLAGFITLVWRLRPDDDDDDPDDGARV